MNRNEEFENLLQELDNTPAALEYTVTRARARAQKKRRARQFTLIPAGSLAVFFAMFVALVNVSMTFASACGRLPLLRELARAVALSPSLSAAVDNEFVQPIMLEQTENDITLRIEYVIVDQKQLNIFYTLNSGIYSHMDLTPEIKNPDGPPFESYGISSGESQVKNGELRKITVDFFYGDVPDALVLRCRVHDNGSDTMVMEAPVPVPEDHLFQPSEYIEPEFISAFEFTLEFDSEYTQQAEIIELNQSFLLDGQRLTAETIEIFPTHIRLNLTDDESNTAWLQSLTVYLENEKGKRFEAVSNGITATGSADSPMMCSYRLESAFFSKSRELTLYITGAVWLDKDMERVKIDLANACAEKLPEGVTLRQAERREAAGAAAGGWQLTFSAPEHKKNYSYQLFMARYYDENGTELSFNSWSAGGGGYYDDDAGEYIDLPGEFTEQFTLRNYPYDTVWLTPAYSRRVALDTPVVITVK